MASNFSESVVDAIIRDLSDRAGLGNEWDAIDSDIQDEIRDAWIEIIEDMM